MKKLKQVLPYPEIFIIKLRKRIIPKIGKKIFLERWRRIHLDERIDSVTLTGLENKRC